MRHVCHQGAHASTKIGNFLDLASANAREASSSIHGNEGVEAGAGEAERAAAAASASEMRLVHRMRESYAHSAPAGIDFRGTHLKEDEE